VKSCTHGILMAMIPLVGVCSPLSAQDNSAPKPAPIANADPEKTPPAGLGNLDDLLGLERQDRREGDSSRGEALDAIEGELDRALSGQEVTQAFQDAVALMGDSARRLSQRRDAGIDTQRMQTEAIRKLETLIEAAQQQQSQQQQQQQGQQQQQQPNQQQQQQQREQRGDNQDEMMPPGAQDAQLNPGQAADLAAWGALPARMRDALLQGASDRFSTLYRGMTERYFQQLAEEGEP